MSSFVPSAITQPFFEVQIPDFAWKLVCAVPTNYKIIFFANFHFGQNLLRHSIQTSMQNLESVAQKMAELLH